ARTKARGAQRSSASSSGRRRTEKLQAATPRAIGNAMKSVRQIAGIPFLSLLLITSCSRNDEATPEAAASSSRVNQFAEHALKAHSHAEKFDADLSTPQGIQQRLDAASRLHQVFLSRVFSS